MTRGSAFSCASGSRSVGSQRRSRIRVVQMTWSTMALGFVPASRKLSGFLTTQRAVVLKIV